MSTRIRYIVLTDVHLGAGNSILTRLAAGRSVADTHEPSPALRSLADCLRALVAGCNGPGQPPTLIAAGDLIDLALSSAERALPVFGQFGAALMTPNDPVIADEVILLPGNHDHLTWDYARERWLEDRLVAAGGRLDGMAGRRTGPMLLDAEPAIVSVPLTSLLQGSTRRAGARVRVLYPDLALPSADGQRLVLVTHGHYIDPVCTSMSEFARLFAPHATLPADAETLERENWPWIDFFFSSMTRSGKPGELVELIYEALQDERAFDQILEAVARNVTIDQGRLKGGAERWAIKHVAGGIVGKLAAARERGDQSGVLSAGARKALGAYIDALRRRVESDLRQPPAQTSLILGHTHKPFAERWADDRWPAGGLGVYNTGGWVVDHHEPRALEGGAVALVDDDHHVALVRMYQQIEEPGQWHVAVETTADDSEDFAARLRDLIAADTPPWSTFAAAAAELVVERRQQIERTLAEEIRLLDT
jgi:UDP-2,3-diacylglucosamine pyrophosphatase LpxH